MKHHQSLPKLDEASERSEVARVPIRLVQLEELWVLLFGSKSLEQSHPKYEVGVVVS